MTPLRLLSMALGTAMAGASLAGSVFQVGSVSSTGVPSTVGVALAAEPTLPGRWLPPIESPLQVSGPYRAPPSPYAAGHRGIDIPAAPGDAVLAPVAGTVTFVGRVVDREVLSVRVDARTTVSFEPVDAQTVGLLEGAEVLRGAQIGVVASGGHCVAECLHLGVRVDDAYVNPMRYFFQKPVLLPW